MEPKKQSLTKKLTKIYDILGYVSVIGAILSGITMVWIPWLGVKLFFSFVILFVGILILYGCMTKEGRNIAKNNLSPNNKW